MNDMDGMLARLATVHAPRSLGDDPAFVARLDASAARGEMLGTVRSLAIGIVIAGLMVVSHPRAAVAQGGAGFLLATTGGEVL